MIRASTLVKKAALAMVGTSLLIFPAAAQQMAAAASGPNFAACDAIKDPARSVQCYHDTKIAHYKGRIAAAEARGAAADARIAEGDCAARLVEVAKIPAKQARGAALLQAEGKDVEGYGACRLLSQLTP